MKNAKLFLSAFVLLLAIPVLANAQQSPAAAAAPTATTGSQIIPAMPMFQLKGQPVTDEDRITREVRHELVMQPFYTIWDWLAFRVNGNTVELLGQVYSPGLKGEAVKSVKRIEGVEKVIDHIEELPPSPMDDRIRHQVAHAIFNFGNLSRYSWSAFPSIHIIVNRGRVRLVGVVDSQADKDAATIRANGVSGVFEVTNDLMVVKS